MTSAPVPRSASPHRALEAEIKAFCLRSNLTPRESDIMNILVGGVVRIKDVAERLNLSPNTINNHVNSIFTKTKTTSKSQLLAEFLNYVTEELERVRFFRQTPQVLVLAKNTEQLTKFLRELSAKGFQMSTVSSVSELLNAFVCFRPRFTVIDLSLVSEPIGDFLLRAQAVSLGLSEILFVGSKVDVRDRAHAMHLGAMDLLAASFEASEIYLNLMCRYIESDSDRMRFLSTTSGEVCKTDEILTVRSEQVGLGGVAVPNLDLKRATKTDLKLGEFVELNIRFIFDDKGPEIDQRPFCTRGQIVWRKEENEEPSQEAGRGHTGVRFMHLPRPVRDQLEQFTRARGIKSFIPMRF